MLQRARVLSRPLRQVAELAQRKDPEQGEGGPEQSQMPPAVADVSQVAAGCQAEQVVSMRDEMARECAQFAEDHPELVINCDF